VFQENVHIGVILVKKCNPYRDLKCNDVFRDCLQAHFLSSPSNLKSDLDRIKNGRKGDWEPLPSRPSPLLLAALSPGKTITTYRNVYCWAQHMLHAFGHPVATWCNMLCVCWLKFDPFQTWANKTQHVATHRNTVAKLALNMLRWHVAIVWPSLKEGPVLVTVCIKHMH